ncbi:hypothetical protein ABIE52_006748 [Rhodococcus sp. OAS809]|uniref:hypothetical protein n=1 Tax=Rhodococcus sp. OAS809 TaxID=2663874 RepID=UPI00178A83EA
MATAAAHMRLVSVPPVVRLQIREIESMRATFERMRASFRFAEMPSFLSLSETSAHRAHQSLLRSISSIRPAELQILGRYTHVDSLLDLLTQPKSVEGVPVLLAGFRNALAAALNLQIGNLLAQITNNVERHGKTPGQLVTSHPQVTRGPNVRRSTRRSSADLVMT